MPFTTGDTLTPTGELPHNFMKHLIQTKVFVKITTNRITLNVKSFLKMLLTLYVQLFYQ